MSSAIVFRPEILEAAKARRAPTLLLHKWALRPEEHGGHMLRAQLERAAALVPDNKRTKVLGPLGAPSDDQVRAAVGVLLLAKTLNDLGWRVEFEPEIAEGTPDLRVAKSDAEYLVEVRRVRERETRPSQQDLARVRDTLDGIKTRTPVSVTATSFDGKASLKPFRRHMERLLAGTPSPGRASFHENGVYVGFDILKPFDEPISAYFGCRFAPVLGNQNDEVRAHITEKLIKYKVPLVVALDFFDFYDPFTAVEEVLLGSEVMNIPIDLVRGGSAGEPYAGRADDGMLGHAGADGQRARARLQAVLAFGLPYGDDGCFQFRGRAFANPGADQPLALHEFAPIPRLVVVRQTETERVLKYLDVHGQVLEGRALTRWKHVP